MDHFRSPSFRRRRPTFPVRHAVPVALALAILLAACGRKPPTQALPGAYTLSGHVVLKGFLVAPDGTFAGTRVLGDVDGVPVELVAGTRVVDSTVTSGGVYTFTGVRPGGYIVRSLVFDTVGDQTDALNIVDHDLASADTLRLYSFGDLAPVPNPLPAETIIFFSLADTQHVDVRVVDLAGRPVRTILDEQRPPGPNSTIWDGRYPDHTVADDSLYWLTFASGFERRLQLLFR